MKTLNTQEKGWQAPPATVRGALQRRSDNTLEATSAPPIIEDVARSPGRTLDTETRQLFEASMGHDFSHVRIHDDALAAKSAREIGTTAYSYGNHVVFGTQKRPESIESLHILSHELTHIVLGKGGRKHINCWGGADHERITYEAARNVIDDDFFVYSIASRSSLMDVRTRRIFGTLPPYVLSKMTGSALGLKGEGPEHGEAGYYLTTNETAAETLNLNLQNEYFNKALIHQKKATTLQRESKPVHTIGSVFSKSFDALALACHIAQDRGAHGEGVKGRGHDDPRTKTGWDADNTVDNKPGYQKAVNYTKDLLKNWNRLKSK